MISILVILGLVLVWAVVLLPDLASKVSSVRRSDPIRSFNSQLSSLGRSAPVHRDDNVIDLRSRKQGTLKPRISVVADSSLSSSSPLGSNPPAGPRPVSAAMRKRRQDVLLSLGAAVLLTLLATVAFGGAFLYLNLVADVLLAAYLVALQRVGNTQGAHAPSRTSADALGQQGLGQQGLGQQGLGQRVGGSRVLGSRVLGSRVLGSRVLGSRAPWLAAPAGGYSGPNPSSRSASPTERLTHLPLRTATRLECSLRWGRSSAG